LFGSTGLKVNGKVFAMLVKGKLVVKLPNKRVEALMASGDGAPFDPGHGRLMKEWVAVGPQAEDTWLGLAKEAKDFVAKGK
jgi:TfoX/Sxy family transcriptional regulator of competence genes